MNPEYLLLDSASRLTWQQYQDEDIQIIPYYGCKDLNDNYLSVFHKETIPLDDEFFYDERVNTLIYGGRDYVKNFPMSGYGINDYSPEVDPRLLRWVRTLDYCLKNFEFDFVFRTTDAYYVDVKKLKGLLEENYSGKTKIYTGATFFVENKPTVHFRPFVAGSAVLLSRDTVEVLVKCQDKCLEYGNSEPEDVATGRTLYQHAKYINIEDQPDYAGCPAIFYQEALPLEELKLAPNPNQVVYKIYNHYNYSDIRRFMKIHHLITSKYSV